MDFVGMPVYILVQKLADIRQSVDELWPISRWRPPPSWTLKISIFGHVTVIGFNICCSVPNFIKIDFSLRYGDLAIFKMAAVRHLRFVMTSQYCIAGHIFIAQILSWNFMLIGVVVIEILAISYVALYITDHVNFGVAHALCHVTLSPGSKVTICMKFLTPICLFTMPLVYASTMTIKRCSKGASLLFSDFYAKIFQVPSKMVPKEALIWGKWGLNIRVLGYFASKSVQRPWLGSELQEPPKMEIFFKVAE